MKTKAILILMLMLFPSAMLAQIDNAKSPLLRTDLPGNQRGWIAMMDATEQDLSRGQKNDVLLAGEPPLTQEMVNDFSAFFEWALEVTLTPSQRQSLKTALIKVWINKDKSEIEGTLSILQVQARLSQATPAERDSIREKIQPGLLENLRANPNDETSRMLLSAYESAHRQNRAVNNRPSSSSAPIIGKWYSGSGSGVNFYNPSTGQWAAPSGTGSSYEFFPDGRYVQAGLLQSSMYSCTMTVFVYETGRWSLQGNTILFSPISGRVKSQDNCNRSFNYEKPKDLKKHSATISFRPNEYSGEEQLCLTDENGEVCYRRDTP
jgi:hypothetical protein